MYVVGVCSSPEVRRVLDGAVPQFDAPDPSLLESLLEEEGLQSGIQLLPHVLQQDGGAKLDAVLQGPDVVRVSELDHLGRAGEVEEEPVHMHTTSTCT